MKQLSERFYFFFLIVILLSVQSSCISSDCQKAEIICEKVRNLEYELEHNPQTHTERIDSESRLEYLKKQCLIKTDECGDIFDLLFPSEKKQEYPPPHYYEGL